MLACINGQVVNQVLAATELAVPAYVCRTIVWHGRLDYSTIKSMPLFLNVTIEFTCLGLFWQVANDQVRVLPDK
jgi:hypothetical protein